MKAKVIGVKGWGKAVGGALCGVMASAVVAQDVRPSYSTFGMPGLIDMPTALSPPDSEIATTVFSFGQTTRATVTFQVTPRLTAAFRYAELEGLGGVRNSLFDRSFDLHYRLIDEGQYRPAVAIGLRDFVGTGVYSSEYVVATKMVSPRVSVTAGLGWGRLASANGFANPLGVLDPRFETRNVNARSASLGGQVDSQQWFRGDAAFFGGIAWQATDNLQVKLEYSSDAYMREVARSGVRIDSPVNFGLDYRWREGASLQVFYMHGNRFGAQVSLIGNARSSRAPSGTHPAPFPVRVRGTRSLKDLGWVTDEPRQVRTRTRLVAAMAREGLEVEGLTLDGTRVHIQIRNGRYGYAAEAIGRTARVLTQVMPDSVETFEIVPVELGMATSQISLKRSDVEILEHAADGAEKMLARARISDAPLTHADRFDPALYPRLLWNVGPYFRVGLFDPDYPIRTDYGVQVNAEYNIARGLYLSGSLRHRLGGNIDRDIRSSNSVIQRVRSDAGEYARQGETALETLTLAYYFRPGRDLYGRVTAGYLEPMFGGISAELLWKPVDSRFALGAELNYVKQRDFNQRFGFRDYEVATGHVSAYWELGQGFHAQIDAGRYLAGDWGATFALDKEFRNGWRVGAYATFTDVSFDDFGEGSFDKGIRFVIPLEAFTGQPSRRRYAALIQPLSRDGGARLQVNGRLYESVRGFHRSGLESSWGRFWR